MEANLIIDILKETLVLTLVVAGIMLFVDFVRSRTGKWAEKTLWNRRKWSVPLASLLGTVPGCMGGYVAVSLYDKRVIPFGALLAMAVATMGDETFMMIALFPKTAVLIMAGMALAGIVVGYVWVLFADKERSGNPKEGSEKHDTHAGHDHSGWKHSLEHALKVFVWAFCIMFAIGVAGLYIDLEAAVSRNLMLMVVLAVALGMIPQSGPHMVFVTLFAQGILPLPVLIASCISQEGHAGLPLIAGDKSAFLRLKLIKGILALAAGWIGLLFI